MAFYEFQATLPVDAPSYVERQADRALMEGLLAGEFCYVLTSRQMGKSSLLVHTAARLRAAGHQVVLLDLMGAGTNVTPEQWYDGLVIRLGNQLACGDPLEDYWLDHARLSPVQRLFDALRDVVLPHLPPLADGTPSRLFVFIDEVDTVGSLPFYADEFFAAIRECYNARVSEPLFERLAFALFGVATLAQLIRDPAHTPFLMGRRIELEDFSPAEAEALARGLSRPEADAARLLERVLDWTHGHPYLTQRLCQALAEHPEIGDPTGVDGLCRATFLDGQVRDQEPNLACVRQRLLRCGAGRGDTLRLYDQIRRGQAVPDDEQDPAVGVLRVSGLVRVERGLLVVHNRIYAEAFDEAWVRSQATVQGGTDPRVIAVLPFRDLSAEPTDYLCDGLTDELIRALGQTEGARVVSRHSVFQFKGRSEDPRLLGVQLGASLLVRGSVRRLGSRVQIAAELLATDDGRTIWSGTYRQGAEDWHLAQREVTRAVLEQLATGFGRRSPSTRHLRQSTDDPQAHGLYLKGLYHLHQRTEATLRRSLTFFQAALALDANYASALAGAANAYILLGIYNASEPRLICPLAHDAARRAIDQEETLAEAHAAIATVHALYDRDFSRAEAAYRRAIELNPSHAHTRQWFAVMCLTPQGRHEEALDQLRTAQELDPLSPSIPASAAFSMHLAGRPTDAAEQVELALEMRQDFWLPHLFLGWIHEQAGRFSEGAEALNTAIDLSHGDPAALASLAHLRAVEGAQAEAVVRLEQLQALANTRYVPPAELALVSLGLQQKQDARRWLEKAREDHSFRLIYSRIDPRFAPAWHDPNLAKLL